MARPRFHAFAVGEVLVCANKIFKFKKAAHKSGLFELRIVNWLRERIGKADSRMPTANYFFAVESFLAADLVLSSYSSFSPSIIFWVTSSVELA